MGQKAFPTPIPVPPPPTRRFDRALSACKHGRPLKQVLHDRFLGLRLRSISWRYRLLCYAHNDRGEPALTGTVRA